ncbi:MAG: ABC transporter permease [Burkholderiales bacterium]|nr:MAG: ABC transporter permease [Burkholderiales bacterium]
MSVFILRRLFQSLIVVAAMSVIVFFGVTVVGDPVHMFAPADATQEEIERVIRQFGLDQPIWIQYWQFVKGAFAGDLGRSFAFGEPALKVILQRMPATLELAFAALAMAVVIGIPLGLYAGLRPTRPVSRAIMAGSIFGFSLPTFWVGIMLIMVFAVMLGWLPATGRGETVEVLGLKLSLFTADGLSHLLLPALNLALLKISLVIRLTRAGVREAVLQDYMKFARAKGLAESRVIGVHLLKNIMIPVVTVLGLEFGSLIAFSVVTETIFAWPGMGKLLIEAIIRLDRPIIVAYLMMIVVLFVVINLVVDVIYSLLDPRVRLQEAGT